MGEKKTTPITINEIEYILEDLTEEQQTLVNHVADLDRKISSTRFNLDQLSVGREAFMEMLTKQLEEFEAVDESKES
jgi:chromosome segregation ATPase|tara:strand:- start:547 stop:777 length:231 start_codon:yes stop_codon:yes gene_type:complete